MPASPIWPAIGEAGTEHASESTLPEGWKVEAQVRVHAGEALTAAAIEVVGLVRSRLS